ncbi:response regulator [Leadbetterella sp. DM7]|uniref:response regulator n=1 Tax=Leadbetterella sp. DM7 TaxID=3235085 RepID=UPI00349E5C96
MRINRILIADDHQLVAESLGVMLAGEPFFHILGIVNNGWQALDYAGRNEVDIIIADLHMPLLNGLEMAHRLKEVAPETKVVILTMSEESKHIREALSLGIDGYVMKSASKAELIASLMTVANGQKYFSENIARKLAEIPFESSPDGKLTVKDVLPVTRREREIIRLIAEDLSNAAIGDRLQIASTTVETHRRNIMRKLGVNSAVALVRWGMKYGVIDKDK